MIIYHELKICTYINLFWMVDPPILCVEYFKHRVDLALSTVIYDGCNWFMFNHIPRLVMCLFNELINCPYYII